MVELFVINVDKVYTETQFFLLYHIYDLEIFYACNIILITCQQINLPIMRNYVCLESKYIF